MSCLVALAAVALTLQHSALAARWYGAVDALLELAGVSLPHYLRDEYDQGLGSARSQLEDATFFVTHSAIRGRSLEEIVAEVLAGLPDLMVSPGEARGAETALAPGVPIHDPDRFALTRREQDVLALLCKRFTDAEIADRLYISQSTVNHHVAHILGKLGAANRRDAGAIAARHALV